MVDDYLLRAKGLVEYLRKLRQQNDLQKKLFNVENTFFDNRIDLILKKSVLHVKQFLLQIVLLPQLPQVLD